jgi:hypothetical protein
VGERHEQRSRLRPFVPRDLALPRPIDDGVATEGAALLSLAAIAYLLALWAKPAAVVVPVMAGLLEWLLTRRRIRDIAIPSSSPSPSPRTVMLITRKLQTVELVTPTRSGSRPIVALDAVAFYLWKLVWPWRLLVDYGRTPQWLIEGPSCGRALL